jgi:hypothetical protein
VARASCVPLSAKPARQDEHAQNLHDVIGMRACTGRA